MDKVTTCCKTTPESRQREREQIGNIVTGHVLAFLAGAWCAVSFLYAMAGPLS